MLSSLPEPARGLLSEEVNRRTYRLVAVSRFPHLVLLDLFTLVGTVAALGFLAEGVREFVIGMVGSDILIMQLALGVSATLTLWATFHFSWTDRAADRIEFIEEGLGTEEAEQSAKVNRIFVVPSILLGLLCSFGLLAASLVAAFHVYEWNDLLLVLLLTAGLMASFFTGAHVHEKSRLGKVNDRLLRAAARDAEVSAMLAANADRQAAREAKRNARQKRRSGG